MGATRRPVHVALQIGHLRAAEAPYELRNIRANTGAQYGNITEFATMQKIADEIKILLEDVGMKVTILPVTIPPNFYADIFLSLHADGSVNRFVQGYKIASPRRDVTGQAHNLVRHLEDAYGEVTQLSKDPNITWNMIGYYGFNWARYQHSAHPMAVSAIVETGFLSNASDRRVIVSQPEKSAQGIVQGIISFVEDNERLACAEEVHTFC